MKEKFPSLAKETDVQEVQEVQRVSKKLDPRKHTPKHTIITLPKIKRKKRILKAAKQKETVTDKGVPIGYQVISQKKPYRQEGAAKKYSTVMKGKDLHPRLLYPAKIP